MKGLKMAVLTDVGRRKPETAVNRQALLFQKEQGEQASDGNRCLVDWSQA